MMFPRPTLPNLRTLGVLAGASLLCACVITPGGDDGNDDGASDTTSDGGDDVIADGAPDDDAGDTGDPDDTDTGGEPMIACAEDDGSLLLPDGFCATVFADGIGRARHMAVTPSGDLFVAIGNSRTEDGPAGEIVALRDEDGDGRADLEERFGDDGGNGIAWHDNVLYFAQDGQILRYLVPDGELRPTGDPEIVAADLPNTGDHTAKTVVIGEQGEMFVNIGSASNSCQVENRVLESPGVDPCPELDLRAGVFRFEGDTIGQTLAEATLFARGVRNGNALDINPMTGRLWAAQNGRDQLFENWPELYTQEDDDRLPSEEIFELLEGADYGWPYCYHDPDLGEKVLAPEYGGDGTEIGRCADVMEPNLVMPAHWAPLGLHFYRGDLFPEHYHGGMFVTAHGSRFSPEAETPPGYVVAFVPFDEGQPASTELEIFADDFAGEGRPLPDAAEYRPVGLAEGPDGSLYISDDHSGRIWRVFYEKS